jgi:hypothetical protein
MVIESLKYSFPYLFLVLYFIALFILEYIVRHRETMLAVNLQIVRWLSFLGLLLFFGFRGFIGWDWYIYYPEFKNTPALLSFEPGLFSTSRLDYGFIIYLSFVKSIWNNYHFFILINTFIDLLIILLFIKQYSKYSYSFAFLLFIVMGGFYLETDLLRSAKAIMLFILSLKYLRERKLAPYLLINIAGSMFHISAVLFLPLYIFLHKKLSRKFVLMIFAAGLTIFLLQLQYIRPFLFWVASILGEKFTLLLEKYLQISAYSSAYGITIGLLERIITASLIIIYYDKLTRENENNVLFINSYLIYFVFFFYFAEIKIIPVRVGGMFAYAYWAIFPAFLRMFEKKNNRAIFISCFFAYSLIKIAGMTDTILYNYANVLFTQDDFQMRKEIFESSLPVLFR